MRIVKSVVISSWIHHLLIEKGSLNAFELNMCASATKQPISLYITWVLKAANVTRAGDLLNAKEQLVSTFISLGSNHPDD